MDIVVSEYNEKIDHNLHSLLYYEKKQKEVLGKEDLEKIMGLINKLGLELINYDHQWSNELRKEYEKVSRLLSSNNRCQ